MQTYETLTEFLDQLPIIPPNEIVPSFIKAWHKIHGNKEYEFANYKNIMVSISGGSDSDIMLDFIERIGHPFGQVNYVFFDTGLEFQATKEHLKDLENKYGITIVRKKSKKPVPLGCKEYGVPFLNKRVSNYINRLQSHGFKWKDKPFEQLYEEYPNCKAALRWWCNEFGEKSQMNIEQNKWLKEFMVNNPPNFKISDACCTWAKKQTAHLFEKELKPDLICTGVRKSEGGARRTAYKSCFDSIYNKPDNFRPIFWFKNEEKEYYSEVFCVQYSDCYTKYGLKRTGCACCPFGLKHEQELEAAKIYEPKLYIAAWNVFGQSYEYTKAYRKFRELKG